MEFTLLGAAACGAAGLYAMLWWEARRGNAADCTANLWDVALTAAIVGVFAGRVAAMVIDGVNPLTHPGDVLIVRAGVATGWAALAALLTATWLGRREMPAVLDGLAAATLLGLAGWHAGCLTRSACLGSPTDVPWAMTQPDSTVGRHPVELYAAVGLATAAIAIAWLRSRATLPPGSAAGLALAVAGAVRWSTEPLRPTLTGGPVAWYATAIVCGVAATAWSMRRRASRMRSAAS